jgi:hypothetical protein
VDQDQFAAMSVPKMAPEAEPKPYNQNQKRIVDNLPKTRLEGNHYITTERPQMMASSREYTPFPATSWIS